MGKPGKYTVEMNQGATYDVNFHYAIGGSSVDLSGYNIRLHGREKPGGPILVQFDNTLNANGTIKLTGSVANNEDGANGNFRCEMTAVNTSYVPVKDIKFTLELESSANVVTRLLEGPVEVSHDFATSP
jgi:hypothetical protein